MITHLARWGGRCLAVFGLAVGLGAAEPTLAERLGYPADTRLLIVNGDDAGMCHSANMATIAAMETGLMTSATILVPCPWFPEIAQYAKEHPKSDFGLHLCQTSEWQTYRWGPVAPRELVPHLIDPDGYFWHETPQVYAKGNPTEAYVEAKAQITKALAAGIDVTHLDSHMGVLQMHPAYLEQYLQLAVDFNLPVRMASQAAMEKGGAGGMRARFAAKGIVFPDDFIWEDLADEPKDVKGYWMRKLAALKPGVTELFIHAGQPTEELKSITHSWSVRTAEAELFTRDPELRAMLEREKVVRIGWRPLRDLQRKQGAAGVAKP
jgi:predicted glycoside hydrolase/deacetylase ChbG (UPF0249 family)